MDSEPRLNERLAKAIERLSQAGCDTPRLDAELLLAHTLGQERSWLYLHPQARLAPAQAERFQALLARRAAREPLAYITGHKAFFGLEFLVTPAVLIPRPETELLVETVLQAANGRPSLAIADIGTGSGCIAVALAKHLPQADIMAVDQSAAALAVARQNAARHQVAGRIDFRQGDLLTPLTGRFDLILSNPPYVSQAELSQTAPEVGDYEPRAALLGGPDGLAVIERLLAQAKDYLQPGGMLLIEIGAGQGGAVVDLAAVHFPAAHIEIVPDLAGLDRLLRVEP